MYSSLHNHSYFSFLDGICSPKEMLEQAKNVGLHSLAITDHGNIFSYVYFDKVKKDYPDIKMLYGVELYECDDMAVKDENNKYYHLIAIAKNEDGRKALNHLITEGNFDGFYYKPRVDLNAMKPYGKNLIVSSACLASKLAREPDFNKCIKYVNEYKSIFPNYYLEMQSHDVPLQKEYNIKVLKLAKATNTPFIITTDSHAATQEQLKYQKYHVAIARDAETIGETYKDCYIQSEDEIHSIMDNQIGYDNVCIALENTNEIADMCDEISMPYSKPKLPKFPLPEGFDTDYDYLVYLCNEGWNTRNISTLSDKEISEHKKRLAHELSVIKQMEFEGYFLIVWEFIHWAKENDISIGAGRGSGAGSLVNYLLGISQLDPLKFGLIFERFLNPERINMPDIDTDVSDRGRIIEHMKQLYGEDKVCQVANFSMITNIVAIKDIGRILQIPYTVCDKVSKRFTSDNWDECVKNCSDILENHPEYNEWFNIAQHEVGRPRQLGIHAGGVIVADGDLDNYDALCRGSKGERVLQMDKHYCESIGLIKLDLLGLSTLDITRNACEYAHINSWDIDINNPKFFNDKNMYTVLQNGDTDNVFQCESDGMTGLIKKLKPENFSEVSACLALYRPDTMNSLNDYIDRKYHPEHITYLHQDLKPIFEETHGLIVYQEQVMGIARIMGGRTWGGADLLRKGIGKKDKALVQVEADKLYNEICNNHYEKKLARTIADTVRDMGGYSFNKSHSACYSVLTLQTAWLKYYYPTEFYCAVLNNCLDDYGKLNWTILCANKHNVKITYPSINKSQNTFSVINGKILFGLSAIKGVGEKLSNVIIEERNNNGEFKGLDDFLKRVNLTTAQLVMLVKSGAIPCKNKKEFMLRYAKSLVKKKDYVPVKSLPKLSILKDKWGIDGDVIKDKEERLKLYNEKRSKEYDVNQQIKFDKHIDGFSKKYLQNEKIWEFEALSIFLKNNPFIDSYKWIHKTLEEVEDGEKGVAVGIISNVERKKSKKTGNPYAFITLYGNNGSIEFTTWSSQLHENEDMIKRGTEVAILYKKKDGRYITEQMKSYNTWLQQMKSKHNK